MISKAPKIGIVSGIGPLAGSDVLAKLLKSASDRYNAVEDTDYPDILFVSHGIKDVDNTASLSKDFKNEIINMVHFLESQGATIIGIACNTAHLYLKDIELAPSTYLVNLLEEVTKKALNKSGNCALLTSKSSKQQKLYDKYLAKTRISYSEITNLQQDILDEVIGLVMAHKLIQAGQRIDDVLKTLDADVECLLAACTEIPIALAHSKEATKFDVVDSNQVLADVLVDKFYSLKHLA